MVPRINIYQRFGQIGVRIVPPQFQLHTEAPCISIKKENPRIEIIPGRAEITISYEKPQADLGYFRPVSFIWQNVEAAMGAADRAVAWTAAEGDRLGRIEDGGVSFAELEEAKWFRDEREVNIGVLRPPEVTAEVTPVRVRYKPGGIEVQVKSGGVRAAFDWGRVEVYLAVRPEVRVWVDLHA